MKYLMFFLAFGLVTASCDKKGNNDTLEEPDAKLINKENPAELTFKETTYDFGEIAQGEKVEKEYEFTNTGKSPLKIVDAKSSCGCTVPAFPEEMIQPGETNKIKVVFDSFGKRGDIKKKITVSANTYPKTTTEIYLTGKVAD